MRDRYLLLIALAVLLLNMVNTTGDQVMAMIIQKQRGAALRQGRARPVLDDLYANFQTWVSILTSRMQVFAGRARA